MDPFFSFTDKAVLEGVVLPGEQPEENPLPESPMTETKHTTTQEEPKISQEPIGQLTITVKASDPPE